MHFHGPTPDWLMAVAEQVYIEILLVGISQDRKKKSASTESQIIEGVKRTINKYLHAHYNNTLILTEWFSKSYFYFGKKQQTSCNCYHLAID